MRPAEEKCSAYHAGSMFLERVFCSMEAMAHKLFQGPGGRIPLVHLFRWTELAFGLVGAP